MFFPLTKEIVSCLDRASARRLNRLKPDEATVKRRQELADKELHGPLTTEEQARLLLSGMALEFLADLQLEARSLLRRPANAQPRKKT